MESLSLIHQCYIRPHINIFSHSIAIYRRIAFHVMDKISNSTQVPSLQELILAIQRKLALGIAFAFMYVNK